MGPDSIDSPFVYLAPMANSNGEHSQPIILNFADDAKISHPVTPDSYLVGLERHSKMSGVFAAFDAVMKIIQDTIAYWRI